jgi:hypothetical protein
MADKAYFQKFVLSTKVRLSSGKTVPWINVGWNTGALETTDAALIAELDACAEAHIGGVKRITKSEFDDLKKNSSKQSPRKTWRGTATQPLPKSNPKPAASAKSSSPAAAATSKPAPEPVKVEEPVTATGVFPADNLPTE